MTTEIMVIENNGKVIDLVEKTKWDEFNGDETYPEEFDFIQTVTVPTESWNNGDIGTNNHKKFIK